MKKTLILIVSISMAISSSGCVKESSAEPITEAVTSEEIHTESESLTSEEETETESLTSETELDELEQRASEILAELESLEAEDRIIYSEESEEEAEMYSQMMERSREEVRAGKIKAESIEDTVVTLYEDFLTEDEQKEFISELNSLIPQEKPVASTKPAKPKETAPAQPVPQETIPVAEVTQPETYPVSDKIDTSGWGGPPITVSEGIGDQSLTPEQIDRINNIEIN